MYKQMNNTDFFCNESSIKLDFYYSELKYYNDYLKLLKKNNPPFFMIKKKREYEILKNEIYNNIDECTKKIKIETEKIINSSN